MANEKISYRHINITVMIMINRQQNIQQTHAKITQSTKKRKGNKNRQKNLYDNQ